MAMRMATDSIEKPALVRKMSLLAPSSCESCRLTSFSKPMVILAAKASAGERSASPAESSLRDSSAERYF